MIYIKSHFFLKHFSGLTSLRIATKHLSRSYNSASLSTCGEDKFVLVYAFVFSLLHHGLTYGPTAYDWKQSAT